MKWNIYDNPMEMGDEEMPTEEFQETEKRNEFIRIEICFDNPSEFLEEKKIMDNEEQEDQEELLKIMDNIGPQMP